MEKIIKLFHRVCQSTCYVNGLEDILESRQAGYEGYLLSVLGEWEVLLT